MALCLANSLIVCQDFVPYDQLVRYKWWHRHGYMSSTGQCFDIGAATRKSIQEFERRQEEFAHKHPKMTSDEIDSLSDSKLLKNFDVYCSTENAAGNGALMRLAPVPLFFYHYPKHAVKFSGISGQITHGDPSSIDACRYYGALIVAALHGDTKEQLLSNDFYSRHEDWFENMPLHPKIMEIARGSFKADNGHNDGIRGKGYVVQSLEAALWAFWSDENSFKKGALAAVNLGDDTDTTAAIYGQLAGAYYGYKQLPLEWREKLYAEEFILCLSEWITYEGENWKPEKSLIQTSATPVPHRIPETAASSSSKQYQDVDRPSSFSQPTHGKHINSPSKETVDSAFKASSSSAATADTSKHERAVPTPSMWFLGKDEPLDLPHDSNKNNSGSRGTSSSASKFTLYQIVTSNSPSVCK